MKLKNQNHIKRSRRGSALAVTVILILGVSIIVANTLKYALSELKMNKVNELYVEAVDAAELGVDYGFATVIKNVTDSVGIYSQVNLFNTIETPASLTSYLNNTSVQSIEIRGSDVIDPEKKLIDWDDPSAIYDDFRGKYVYQGGVDLYCHVQTSEASVSHAPTVYIKKEVKIIEAPLFSHALFYNDELQIHRPAEFAGDVHTNGNLLINTHTTDATMKFYGSVNAAGNYYRGTSVDNGASGRDPFGNTPTLTNGEIDFSQVALATTGEAQIQGVILQKGLDSRSDDWELEGKNEYDGNLTDSAQGAYSLTPVGSVSSSRDDLTTGDVNEYQNGGYSLIEPLLPLTNPGRKSSLTRENKLAAKADLILRVERNAENLSDPAMQYVLKAYTYETQPSDGVEPTYKSVRIPDNLIGVTQTVQNATGEVSGYEVVNSGNEVYSEQYALESGSVSSGLMDTRTGRPMDLFTLDMERLKEVIETPNSDLSGDDSAKEFREQLGIESDATSWDGVVYFEAPTSLVPDTTSLNETGVDTYSFEYGDPETKNPVELDSVDSPDREDDIVSIAEEFRTQDTSDPGMGLQIINAEQLPSLNDKGFTIASNTSIYTVGNYNADGDLSTGTNLDKSDNTFASAESVDELSAAIFGDSVTVLSSDWPSYRDLSNQGSTGDAYNRKPSSPLEISSSIVTGGYPVFEFFVRSLESWQHLITSTYPNPLVIKGSLVSLYDSEIPLIKSAFNREESSPIDLYWKSFAAYAFTTVRYHQFLADGCFPPGTPNARYFKSQGFSVLYPSNASDKAELESVGFTF
jgi:hypothetical protein